MACVPDTSTFTLQDVVDVVAPSTDSLSECFNDATGTFDPSYEGSHDRLSNFRNYCSDIIIYPYATYSACIGRDDSTFSAARGATEGEWTLSHPATIQCGYSGGLYYISRGFVAFDLSSYSGESLASATLYLAYNYSGSNRTVAVLFGTQGSSPSIYDYDSFTFSDYAFNGTQTENSQSSCTYAYYRSIIATSSNITDLNTYMGSILKLAILHTYDNANYDPGSNNYYLTCGWTGSCASGCYCKPTLKITLS